MVVGGGSTKRSSVRFVDEKEGSKFWLGVEQRLEASNKLYRPELEERRGGPGLSQIDWMGGSSLIPFPSSFASFHFSHFSLPPFVLAAKSTLAATSSSRLNFCRNNSEHGCAESVFVSC